MAESANALALLPYIGLMHVYLSVPAIKDKNIWTIGKNPAIFSALWFPVHRWKTSDVKLNGGW